MSAAVAASHSRKNLMQFLAAPAKVASKMNWKQQSSSCNILAVDIGPDRIGLAVAPHPSNTRRPIRTLEPIPVTHRIQNNRRILSPTCVQAMASVVQEHSVCAFLVAWPVQHEGRCGKPCGQVLHALESLLQEQQSDDDTIVITSQRPVCLWDDRHVQARIADEWGRDPLFGDTGAAKNKTVHLASQEQYQHHVCSSAVAAQVWKDFSKTYWPQIEISDDRIVDSTKAAAKQEEAEGKEQVFRIEQELEEDDEEELRVACM